MEFVNLTEDILPEIQNKGIIVKSVEEESLVETELIYVTKDTSKNIIPEEENTEVCESCDVSQFYGDTSPEGYFLRKNLFSELTNEFERARARLNLGIGDVDNITWGNLSGNLANQKDLYNFILLTNSSSINALASSINNQLSELLQNVQSKLDNKAPLDSPKFFGTPTTTNPLSSDYSNRIPTTEWVMNKLSDLGMGSLNWVRLSQDYMYIGDPATNIVITWAYNEPIEKQFINGVEINISQRSYTFSNVTQSLNITLAYIVGGNTYTKTMSFSALYPTYYGSSNVFFQNYKTKDNELILNSDFNEYGYLFIPGNSEKRIAVDNIVGGFVLQGHTVLHDYPYIVYKTYNNGLGKLNITIT